jgi:hypothetical protein
MTQPLPLPDAPDPFADRIPPTWRDGLIERQARLWDKVLSAGHQRRTQLSERATYVSGDALQWLAELPTNSLHAAVTAPPYGLIEYNRKDHER